MRSKRSKRWHARKQAVAQARALVENGVPQPRRYTITREFGAVVIRPEWLVKVV